MSELLGRKGENKKPATPSAPTYSYKEQQFLNILKEHSVDMKALRSLAWNGIPAQHRNEEGFRKQEEAIGHDRAGGLFELCPNRLLVTLQK